MLADLELAYQELEHNHNIYIDNLDSDDDGDAKLLETVNSDMDVTYTELNKARSILALKKKNSVVITGGWNKIFPFWKKLYQ